MQQWKFEDQPLTPSEERSLERWAFNRAAEKDARAADGITGRIGFLLDEKNKAAAEATFRAEQARLNEAR